MKPVKLDDKKTEALLAELLPPGEQPTPPRVRQLLAELAEKRRTPMSMLPPVEGIHDPEPPPGVLVPGVSAAVAALAETDDHDIPAEDQDEIIRAAKDAFRDYDVERRRKIMAQPVSTLRKASRIETLTEAATILLAELDPPQRDLILQIAAENTWPPWVVVLGAVARAADLQELMAGEFKPEWMSQSEKSEHVIAGDAKCLQCHGAIPNARRGQLYCCSKHGSEQFEHSEDCGLGYRQFLNGSWIDTRR